MIKRMLLNGSIYSYRGMKVRYIGNVANGQAIVLFNGVKITVDRHEILTQKINTKTLLY